MEITVPEANVGDVYSDMSSRGGRVQGSDAAGGGLQTVRAEVPLREVTTYARTLSSMTGGQGSFTMEFSHYDVMPGNVQQKSSARRRCTRRKRSSPLECVCRFWSAATRRRFRISIRDFAAGLLPLVFQPIRNSTARQKSQSGDESPHSKDGEFASTSAAGDSEDNADALNSARGRA